MTLSGGYTSTHPSAPLPWRVLASFYPRNFLFFMNESNISLCGPIPERSTESSLNYLHKFSLTVLKVRGKNFHLSLGMGGPHSTIVLRETLNFQQLQATSLFTILYLNGGEELRITKLLDTIFFEVWQKKSTSHFGIWD